MKCFQSAFDPIIEPTPRLGCHLLASAFADDNPASDKVLNGASQRLLVWGDFIHHPTELLAEFSARQAQMSSAQVSSVSSGGYQDFEIRAVVFEGKFMMAAQGILSWDACLPVAVRASATQTSRVTFNSCLLPGRIRNRSSSWRQQAARTPGAGADFDAPFLRAGCGLGMFRSGAGSLIDKKAARRGPDGF